jgi:acyl-coenzyme A thioesterase PaaI-like protein
MAEVRTLQGADGDDFWSAYEAIMGADGLMTYRYVGSSGAVALDDRHATSTATLRRDLRRPAGLLAAALEIMGGDCLSIIDDAIAIPAPAAYSLHVVDGGDGVEEVRVHGEITHAGRTQLFTRFRVEDASDPARVLALGTNSSVVLGPAPAGHRYVPPGPGVGDSPSLPPLWEAFGATRHGGGRYEIPELTARLGSTSASLHHGPTQVVLEAAATDVAVDAAGTEDLRIAQWTVTFLARGKAGPFVSESTVVAAGADLVTCEASLRDDGVGGRRIAMATATFLRTGAPRGPGGS